MQTAPKLRETVLLVGIVCGTEAETAFRSFARAASTVAAICGVGLKQARKQFREFLRQLSDGLAVAEAAVRKELGINDAE
ncbi:MAG TPA: hypothetical protein VF783_05075 [Terriglobales bacterium]